MTMNKRSGAERYLEERLRDREAYGRARRRIDQIDRVVRALDKRREELNLTKAELARRADMPPEAVRRLFSAERPNPTLYTLASIAEALGLDLVPGQEDSASVVPRSSTTRGRSDASGTRRRTA
jgi:DNA-binding phage protein